MLVMMVIGGIYLAVLLARLGLRVLAMMDSIDAQLGLVPTAFSSRVPTRVVTTVA